MPRECCYSVPFLLVLFIASVAVAVPAPVLHYTFDTFDQPVPDASGNGNDGEVKGGVALSDDGYLGKSFEFDGANGHVLVPRMIEQDFTLMSWIKTDTPGVKLGNHAYQGSAIFWSDVGGVANDFILAVLGPNLSFFAGNPDTSVNSTEEIVTGDWVHVAAVRDTQAGTLSIFIDGLLVNSVEHANGDPLDAQPNLAIGGNTLDSRYYTGLMDDVKVFDAALTEAEVAEATSPAPVEPAGKLAITWAGMRSAR